MEDLNKQDSSKSTVKRIRQRYLMIAAAAATAIIAVSVLKIAQTVSDNNMSMEKENGQEQIKENEVHIFQNLSDLFYDQEDGTKLALSEMNKNISVLVYWASWCPHCTESLKELPALAEEMKGMGASVYLINKLDGTKETKEQALQFLEQNQIDMQSYFDTDCKNYDKIGLHMIPTTIVIDKNQNITSILEGSIPESQRAAAMIEEAESGKTAALESFITEALMNEEGGIKTTFLEVGTAIPSGGDILSESQGVLMEYAALKGERELFDRVWGYVRENLFPEGMAPWVISDKEETNVNALVDDLRIVKGLLTAQERWEGYQESCVRYADAIYSYNVQDEKLVDFYDFKSNTKAGRFTLCYGDLRTLSELGKSDKRYRDVYENTLELIQGGKISESFPLYYNYYDYSAQKYMGGNLHMAEGLTTLLHLAQVGELPADALAWLEERLDEGCIYAVYGTDGKPSAEGYFESTAVYALTARIALEAGRKDIAGKAVSKMEQFKIQDIDSGVNGAFGESDGSGIYSFDQGMALLAYERFERELK